MNRKLLLLLILCLCCRITRAEEPTPVASASGTVASLPCVGPSEVWTINTRRLPCPTGCRGDLPEPTYRRLDNGCWVTSSRDEFLATHHASGITCVFVHGNLMDAGEANQLGMKALRRFGDSSRPARFIIWSWPSEHVSHRPILDVRAKAARADGESWYLARFLSDLPEDSAVSLIGYSFGARTVIGSGHLLGGGQIYGRSLDPVDHPLVRPRLVLIAGAVTNHWIVPNHTYGQVSFGTDAILSFYNPLDPVLKFFHISDAHGKPKALGYCGISQNYFGPEQASLEQRNVSQTVGRSHSFDRYADSRWIANRIQQFAMWEDAASVPSQE